MIEASKLTVVFVLFFRDSISIIYKYQQNEIYFINPMDLSFFN